MKKLLTAIMMTLALNFLLVAGGAGWLFKTGHLDKDRLKEVRNIIFPPAPPPAADSLAAQADATTQPSTRLDALVALASGRTVNEQVDFIQQTFDAQAAQLDRRERELNDLQHQVDLAKSQMAQDRARLQNDQKDLTSRQQQDVKQASDKGFQDSLQLYSSIPAKNVKTIFLTLNDDIVQQYLQAMPTRTAAKIIKEYKTPEELNRIQKVLERMRSASEASPAQQANVQSPTAP